MTHGSRFTPAPYQTSLPIDKLILKNVQLDEETVPMDVVFVGGGPAGLAGAIELARLIKEDTDKGGQLGDIEIGVLEKAGSLGGHSLSGAVVNPSSLQMLFPEINIKDFPFRGAVKGDAVFLLTESGSIKIPTPPTMHNQGHYIASICEIVRWMGEKAESLGVNILTSFPVESLLVEGEKVVGLRTTPAGLLRDGSPGPQYMPSTDITSKIAVLCEGSRGPLTQAYLKWQGIEPSSPQIYALGVKEVWRVKKVPDKVTHSLGWPLPKDVFGGSFMYPMGDDLLALGLVVGLDYRQSSLDVHQLLQKMKQHAFFKAYLDGGEVLEWGAKTIPEGGFHSFPQRFHGEGLLMAGDAVGMVNVPALKGIHYAMLSGIYAARTAFEALKKQDNSASQLSQYDQLIKSSPIYSDLYKVRGMRQAFKSGFYLGGIKASIMMASGGTLLGGKGHTEEDAGEWKESVEAENECGLKKVDAVYLSGNKTRDDIPSHLEVKDGIPERVQEFYTHMCPAGVYEKRGKEFVVNAPNCVDCKATDVLGPRWRPREGGSGPNYNMM